MGVDVGSDWVTNINGGVTVDGFSFAPVSNSTPQTSVLPRTGLVVKNVIVLEQSSSVGNHAFVIQNAFQPIFKNDIAIGGFAGFVDKAIGAQIDGYTGYGCSTASLWIKTNGYSFAERTIATNIHVLPLLGNDGSGVRVDGTDTTGSGNGTTLPVFNTIINGINALKTSYALNVGGKVKNILVSGIMSDSTTGTAVILGTGLSYGIFDNMIIKNSQSGLGGDGIVTSLTTSDVGNFISNSSFIKNAGNGMNIANIGISGIVSDSNILYGINGTNVKIGIVYDSTGNGSGPVTGSNFISMFPSALTISTGLTKTGSTVTNDLITGKSGGQTVSGGTATTDNLTLTSTTNSTKSKILFGSSSGYDESQKFFGIGTTSPAYPLSIKGGNTGNPLVAEYTANDGGISVWRNSATLLNATAQLRLTLGTTQFGASDVTMQVTLLGQSSTTADFVFQKYQGGSYTEYARFKDGGNLSIGSTSATSKFNVGTSNQFQVDANGNIVKLNNVTTSFPSSNSVGVLTNNGSGTFTWVNNGSNGTPTIAAGTGAGTSPTVTIVGNNLYGKITVTTGSTPSASAVIATITFGSSFNYSTSAAPLLIPLAGNAAQVISGSSAVGTTGGTSSWTFSSGTAALTGSTTYTWYYSCGGY